MDDDDVPTINQEETTDTQIEEKPLEIHPSTEESWETTPEVEVAEEKSEEEFGPVASEEVGEPDPVELKLEHRGGPWYEVDGQLVRGKAKALELLRQDK